MPLPRFKFSLGGLVCFTVLLSSAAISIAQRRPWRIRKEYIVGDGVLNITPSQNGLYLVIDCVSEVLILNVGSGLPIYQDSKKISVSSDRKLFAILSDSVQIRNFDFANGVAETHVIPLSETEIAPSLKLYARRSLPVGKDFLSRYDETPIFLGRISDASETFIAKGYAFCFSSTGHFILVASGEHIIIWDTESNKEIRRVDAKNNYYDSFTLSDDAMSIAALQKFPTESGSIQTELALFLDGKSVPVRSKIEFSYPERQISFSPEAKRVLCTPPLRLLDGKSGKIVREFKDLLHPYQTNSFSSDNRRMSSTSGYKIQYDGHFDFSVADTVNIIELESGEILAEIGGGQHCTVGCFGMSDDELFVGTSAGNVQIWNRHFPEYWWGHFCRPEVWVLLISGSFLMWRICRKKRENSTTDEEMRREAETKAEISRTETKTPQG